MRAFILSLLLAPSLASANPIRVSASASTALTTSYSCVEVSDNASDATSVPFRRYGHLWQLEGTLTSIVTAADVTWFIAKDAACESPITDEVTATIVDHDADGSGGVVSLVNAPYYRDADSTSQSLWVGVKLDAGTATVVLRQRWEER